MIEERLILSDIAGRKMSAILDGSNRKRGARRSKVTGCLLKRVVYRPHGDPMARLASRILASGMRYKSFQTVGEAARVAKSLATLAVR